MIEKQFDITAEVNVVVAGYTVDALLSNGIVVEYDGWYYHKNQLEQDEKRNRTIVEAGHQLLIVQSARSLPTAEQLADAMQQMQNGELLVIITLDDWGVD